MKNKIKKITYFVLLFAVSASLNSCKKKDSIPGPLEINGTGNKCLGCQDYSFVKHFNKTSGTIKQVNNNDYVYQKQQYYIEIEPNNAPELGENTPIRIFICDSNIKFSDNLGKKVLITGDLYDCVTEYHGKPTLNLYTFHVLE